MAYTVNILHSAKTDIEDKVRYLKQEWGAVLAKKAYVELMDKLALLATQPLMGSLVPELVNLGRMDYRVLVHETHTKVLYRVDEGHKVVEIQMVFGSRQDFQELLYKRVMRMSGNC
jgi:plasmid stabilization system protein ParE